MRTVIGPHASMYTVSSFGDAKEPSGQTCLLRQEQAQLRLKYSPRPLTSHLTSVRPQYVDIAAQHVSTLNANKLKKLIHVLESVAWLISFLNHPKAVIVCVGGVMFLGDTWEFPLPFLRSSCTQRCHWTVNATGVITCSIPLSFWGRGGCGDILHDYRLVTSSRGN